MTSKHDSPTYDLLVAGAGSWGTALAIQSARKGHKVAMWAHRDAHVKAMQSARCNEQYLPGAAFPDTLTVCSDLSLAVQQSTLKMIATPSHAFSETLEKMAPYLKDEEGISWASKGFEPGTGRFLHEVAESVVGHDRPLALVTGPSFARELADNLPTVVTVACADSASARQVADVLHFGALRVYTTRDLRGAELGGAVKNVLAVATGIADGMGLGANARAALVTRGLAEMMRLCDALGGERETLMGLSGMGDLVLTATGDLSRNRRFGLALGRGTSIPQALEDIGQVVEGIQTAREVVRLARRHKVDMPISEQVFEVIEENITPQQGLKNLLSREQRPELD